MASRSRRGGDRVLESRHLIGLFLGVVMLCAVFFTLGYVMGKTQYGGSVHASDSLLHPAPAVSLVPKSKAKSSAPQPPAPGEWDFYSNKNENHLEAPSASPPVTAPPPESVPESAAARNVSPRPAAPASLPAPSAHTGSAKVRGSIVLQVAAVTHQSDALAMAEALQQKRFPAFISAPTTDHLYRVQVGPYRDDRAAEEAKARLDRVGFKAIIKR
jgi:cell division septation protein DedD